MNEHPFDFDQTTLSDEERGNIAALEQALDDDTIVSELTPERVEEFAAIAENTINPPKRKVSARLSEPDLKGLKAKALEKGVPYQTLLSSIVHQYVQGTLKEG